MLQRQISSFISLKRLYFVPISKSNSKVKKRESRVKRNKNIYFQLQIKNEENINHIITNFYTTYLYHKVYLMG